MPPITVELLTTPERPAHSELTHAATIRVRNNTNQSISIDDLDLSLLSESTKNPFELKRTRLNLHRSGLPQSITAGEQLTWPVSLIALQSKLVEDFDTESIFRVWLRTNDGYFISAAWQAELVSIDSTDAQELGIRLSRIDAEDHPGSVRP